MNLFALVIIKNKEDFTSSFNKDQYLINRNSLTFKSIKMKTKKEKIINKNKNNLKIYLVHEKNKRFLISFIILFVYLMLLFKRY